MTTAIEYDANSKSHQLAVRMPLREQYMSGGFRRTAQVGVIVQFCGADPLSRRIFSAEVFCGW